MKQENVAYDLFDYKENYQDNPVITSSMPLAMAGIKEKVCVHSLAGCIKIHQRLSSMGLNVGSEIEVIKKGIPGPFLIRFGDTRLAIGAGMAHKIMVTPI